MEQLSHILKMAEVQQLQSTLLSRYGVGLLVDFMTNSDAIDILRMKPKFHSGALLIPIFSGEQFLAQARIPGASHINSRDFDEIGHLINNVLQPILTKWKTSFRSFHQSFNGTSHFTNVIQLFGQQSPVVYLETNRPLSRQKVISEIHEISGRWARVDYEQIAPQIKSLTDIKFLGAITLVINELLNLSPQQIAILVEYIQCPTTKETPLILISSTVCIDEMVREKSISKEIAKIFRQCVLDVDKLPQKSGLFRESVELFLEPRTII